MEPVRNSSPWSTSMTSSVLVHYSTFITIQKHYYAEISMVLAGYSITSIVQNVYWLLKSYFTWIWTPEYHNQVDKFTRIVFKNAYSLHIQQLAIFLAQETLKTRLVLLVASEKRCSCPRHYKGALSLYISSWLWRARGSLEVAKKELPSNS